MFVLCICLVSVDTFFSFSHFIVAISWTSIYNFTVSFSVSGCIVIIPWTSIYNITVDFLFQVLL